MGKRQPNAMGGEEKSRISGQQGDAMSTVPPEELAERQTIGDRYHAQESINRIDEQIRGLSLSIHFLKSEKRRLLQERERLTEVSGLGK